MTLLLFWSSTTSTAGTVVERSKRRAIAAGSSVAPELFAVRYNTAGTAWQETFRRPANVGVRWALPGGMQRMELTIKAASRFEARQRYQDHLGDRIVLLDAYMDRPIADGWVYEVVPDGLHVHYVVGGSWKRHDDYGQQNNPNETDDSDVHLKNEILNIMADVSVNSDMSHIAATNTEMGAYDVRIGGDDAVVASGTIGDMIEDVISMGNDSNQVLDYWLVPAPMNGIYPQLPYAYLQPRDNTAAISWQCRERDLRSLDLSRNIWDLQNEIQVVYRPRTRLTSGESDGATTITVNDATGFVEGAEIKVLLDSNNYFTVAIDSISGSVFTLLEALPEAASTGNSVVSESRQVTAVGFDAASIAAFWSRQSFPQKDNLDLTQALQYRNALVTQYANPAQLSAFTIGAGMIRDRVGNPTPIWRMLINPGLIRINDLFADGQTFTNSIDGRQSFRIVALDYDHSSRSMRVTPDTLNEARLDVLLQRAGIDGVGQMIDRS